MSKAFRGMAGGLEDSSNTDGGGRRRRLGVNCYWSRAALKGGVKQIHVGQDDDQQHHENHAAEDDQTCRLQLPLRHVP